MAKRISFEANALSYLLYAFVRLCLEYKVFNVKITNALLECFLI